MVEELFSDYERKRLLDLAIRAVPQHRGDHVLTEIIAKLGGVDTVLCARRAYPSSRTPAEADIS